MKKVICLFLLSLVSLACFAQSLPCNDRPCVYLTTGNSNSPVVQLDSTQSRGMGLLSTSGAGPAVWAAAIKPGGVGVWAVGINGAAALHVQGNITKPHEPRHLLKLYDAKTGELLYVFEYSFE